MSRTGHRLLEQDTPEFMGHIEHIADSLEALFDMEDAKSSSPAA